MAQIDVLKRYLEAGQSFMDMTQSRAEELVRDLIKAGEVQADQARELVTELVERSRRNSEKMLEAVRTEVRDQITSLGLVSASDLDRLEERLSGLVSQVTGSAKAAADRVSEPAKRAASATAKKVPAKKAPAKKAATKRAPAKKAAAKKAGTAKRAATSTAKKSPAKVAAKKAPAKKQG
jgi:polyhydroxyalkanoate synthesis regulator phasin